MKLKLSQFPLLIILVGILFSVYLQLQIPEGVFFSGDAGLKALLAKQFSSGQLRFDLVSPAQDWIVNLWNKGFYPYGEPFVYRQNNLYYITFPFTFPLITAPFHALFGNRGLYIIPLVSTWITWLVFYWACQRLKCNPFYSAIALIILIFASPLSMYSSMYWEHTLAILLSFTGTAILLTSKSSQGLSKIEAIFSGFLIGLSVWFRPEFLCLVAIIFSLVYISSLLNWSGLERISQKFNVRQVAFLAQNKGLLVISMLITVGLFFLINKLIYNHPLGIHAIQIVEESLSDRFSDARKTFNQLGWALFEYFPLAFFPIIYLVKSVIISLKNKEIKLNLELITYYCICLSFTIGVSLIVPVGTAGKIAGGKQWGARFLLILVPIILLLVLKQLQLLQKSHKILKYSSILLLAIFCLVGTHKNSYQGTVYLQKTHQGVLPAIQFLQQDSNKVIGMSHQFVAQVLEPGLSQEKIFFLAENSNKLVKLSSALLEQKQQEFIYVCYPFRKCQPTEDNPENLQFNQDNRNFAIQLSELGKFGKYPIYKVSINEV